MKKFTFLLIATLTSYNLIAQPGTLDNGFGMAGKVLQQYNLPYLNLGGVLMQTDDKVVVAGSISYDGDEECFVQRYNTNGTSDASFNGTGLLRINLAVGNTDTESEYVDAVEKQADGKIIILVHAGDSERVIRINTNGTVDNSFAAGGLRIPLSGYFGEDLKVLSNGQLMVVGQQLNVNKLVRINSNGTVDNSFGTAGVKDIVLTATGEVNLFSMALQSDGKMVIAGERRVDFSSNYNILVCRLTTDGNADNTFSGDGWQQPAEVVDQEQNGVMVLFDVNHKIVVGGSVNNTANQSLGIIDGAVMLRYNLDGTPDAAFGTNGKVFINKSLGLLCEGYIAQQTDGKYYLGAAYKNVADYEFGLLRLNANGTVDNSYDGDGIARKNLGNGFDYGGIPFVQTDGKVVEVGGSVTNNQFVLATVRFATSGASDNTFNGTGFITTVLGAGQEPQDFKFNAVKSITSNKLLACGPYSNGFTTGGLIVKYNENGTPDNTFGVNGFAGVSVSVGDELQYVTTLPGGEIIAAGTSFDLLVGFSIIVVKLTSAGVLDNSFGTFGKTIIDITENDANTISALAVQADGKIVLSTNSADITTGEETYYLLRLNANGTPDNTFDGDGKLITPIFYNRIAIQTDNKLVATGSFDSELPAEGINLSTSRFNTNGAVDATFNSGNAVVTNFSEEQDMVVGLSITSAGKIIIGCNAFNGSTGNAAIAVYNSNGTTDNTFSGDGKAVFSLPYTPLTMQVSPDGSFIFSGKPDFTDEFAVSRITTTGVPDNSFGVTGSTVFNLGTSSTDEPLGMDIQTDGKILLSGSSMAQNGSFSDAALVRINNSGAVSNSYTFNGNGNWSVAANWLGGQVPPNPIPSGTQVTINHTVGGQCVVNIPVTLSSGGKITVLTGKTLVAAANMIVPSVGQ